MSIEVMIIAAFLGLCVWLFAIVLRLERVEKKLNNTTKYIESARDIAAIARKEAVTNGAQERLASAEVIYQTLLDALENPNIK